MLQSNTGISAEIGKMYSFYTFLNFFTYVNRVGWIVGLLAIYSFFVL